MASNKVVPFGKYKGRQIEELLVDDPKYLEWLAGQDWFRVKFIELHQTIINRGAQPEETPEHNAMQVRFLDNEFCIRFMHALGNECSSSIMCKFEYRGIDVILGDKNSGEFRFRIELKPSVGDDYPAILRQMQSNKSNVLYVGQYIGKGATREQFVKTFYYANIKVVFEENV